jgi:AAA15 family ATPase/GTPase
MLIEFSIGNYRSFNSIQTLSFRATSQVSEKLDHINVVETSEGRLLKTIGVFGANASGKSNLIRGLELMRRIIASSLDAEIASRHIDPFRLQPREDGNAGFFQLIFLLGLKKYRYGFTLLKSGDIESEWLFGPAEKNETYYFKRENDNIQVNKERFQEGEGIPYEKLRKDALFLSFCSSFNGPASKSIREFIVRNVTIDKSLLGNILGLISFSIQSSTNELIERGQKEVVINWLTDAGLNYLDVRIEKNEDRGGSRVILYKNSFDKDGKITGVLPFDLRLYESEGTKKYYNYIGRINRKFQTGGVFCSDEIDANFHPSLLRKLISLFNNPKVNIGNAQLLFSSHETSLMDPHFMRRDQFYFAEKNSLEETRLYSLADLKGVRNNADFARQYLSGYYGAVPLLSNLLEENSDGEDSQDQISI